MLSPQSTELDVATFESDSDMDTYSEKRVLVLTSNAVIHRSDISLPHIETTVNQQPFKEAKAKVIAQFERDYITKLLEAHQGNITRAARDAQKNRRAFWELIRKHGIDVPGLRCSHAS